MIIDNITSQTVSARILIKLCHFIKILAFTVCDVIFIEWFTTSREYYQLRYDYLSRFEPAKVGKELIKN